MSNTAGRKRIDPDQRVELFSTLKVRFHRNMKHHNGIDWEGVEAQAA